MLQNQMTFAPFRLSLPVNRPCLLVPGSLSLRIAVRAQPTGLFAGPGGEAYHAAGEPRPARQAPMGRI